MSSKYIAKVVKVEEEEVYTCLIYIPISRLATLAFVVVVDTCILYIYIYIYFHDINPMYS